MCIFMLSYMSSFTYCSLIQQGAFQISDEDRFFSFIGSYTFGTMIIRGEIFGDLFTTCVFLSPIYCSAHHFGFSGLAGSFLSNFDARLAPEHLFRLCLEHDQKFVSSHKSARRYNFYKVLLLSCPITDFFCSACFVVNHIILLMEQDSNALEISKMAKLLNPLEQRVRSLLDEWENDHALQKLLNVIEMLLNIPLSTPLAKVVIFSYSFVRITLDNAVLGLVLHLLS